MSVTWGSGKSKIKLVKTLEVFVVMLVCLVMPKFGWILVTYVSNYWLLHWNPNQIAACLLGVVAATFVLCTNWKSVFKGENDNG